MFDTTSGFGRIQGSAALKVVAYSVRLPNLSGDMALGASIPGWYGKVTNPFPIGIRCLSGALRRSQSGVLPVPHLRSWHRVDRRPGVHSGLRSEFSGRGHRGIACWVGDVAVDRGMLPATMGIEWELRQVRACRGPSTKGPAPLVPVDGMQLHEARPQLGTAARGPPAVIARFSQ